jgi:GT2 family glycosyltransferase
MRACIVILNWNGWKDTVECLESVFRLRHPDFRVVVCDNASGDGSLENLKRWAQGELAAECRNPQLLHLVSPPCPKPIPYREMDCGEAQLRSIANDRSRLVLIRNGGNLGYAGGNNVGLRFALRDPECQYFWVLNNDTVVDPLALSALEERMRKQPEPGLCGSVIRSYQNPDGVYLPGGRKFSKWTGRSRIPPRPAGNAPLSESADFDYVEGASMFVSRVFLETVGMLEESYFLYFEEVDWAARAQGKSALGFSPKSIVYHKEGASIGSSRERGMRSSVSTQCMMRGKVLVTRRFWPWALPTVLLTLAIAALERLFTGDWQRARLIVASAWQGLIAPLHSRPHGHSDKSTPAKAN